MFINFFSLTLQVKKVKKSLKVYRASAGSGKTFRLAVEYIKLLMNDPTCYRNILAVTFTNKATTEMKLRILSQLYGIGHGLKSSEGYLEAVKQDAGVASLGLSDEQLRRRALTALEGMMHDYSRFRIETIDSFFQSLVRELARELHLTNGLRVDLEANEVVRTAVKELLNSLATDGAMLRTVLGVVEERIDDSRNWHMEDDVTKFGMNIFNERFLENKNNGEITSVQDVEAFRRHLKGLKSHTLQCMQQAGRTFMQACEKRGLDSTCFVQGSKGVWNFLKKTAEGSLPLPNVSDTVAGCLDNPSAWPSKKHPEVKELAACEFMPLLSEVMDLRRLLNSIEAARKHLGQLTLLNAIDSRVRQLNADENRFLLADTAYMLWQLVKGQDVPFIYERSGVRFTHIMIDEFQDTSALQWKNFIPLLLNSMATDSLCLIVGDVKQSIYRWRNGDWGILKDLEKDAKLHPYVEMQPMHTNYRSAGCVVRFNNEFFGRAAQTLQTMYANVTQRNTTDIADAYKDVVQEVVPKNDGHGFVYVEMLKKCQEGTPQPDRIVETVQMLRGRGVRVQDMCILVRKKNYIPNITAAFAQRLPEVNIVSDEAFRLDSSPALNFIILAMRVVANPQNRYLLSTLTYEYRSCVLNDGTFTDINRTFLLSDDDLRQLLPETFREQEATLPTLPLYELAERIYDLFSLQNLKGQDAYLFSFFDKVMAFLAERPSDLDTFLRYWDDTLCSVTIPVGEVNGIRILSIHKSKGLEFHTIIIPYCEWTFTMGHTPMVWVKPKDELFQGLDLLPIDMDKTSSNSCFKDDVADEKLKCYVDNLNLMYVAFTRAVKNLIVFADIKTDKNGENVSQVLHASMPPMETNDKTDTAETFSSGSIVPSDQKDEKDEPVENMEQNVLTVAPAPTSVRFVTQPVVAEFRQSNRATQFAQGDNEPDDEHRRYLNEGVLFHQLLSMIQTPDDLPAAIRRMDFEGYFDNALYRQEVMQLVERAFLQTQASRWFDTHWQVINECNILYRDDEGTVRQRRPDRVVTDGAETIVIDYKTGRQDEEHVKQVQFYMDQLRAMNYPNVSGFVWYIRRGDIVPVT